MAEVLRRSVALDSHLLRVSSIAFEVLSEPNVLESDAILPNVRQKEKGQQGAQQAQAGTDQERILTPSNAVCSTGSVALDDREDVRADKGTDLAHGRRDRVVLAPDGGGASLGSHDADVVACPYLAQREEDAFEKVVSAMKIK